METADFTLVGYAAAVMSILGIALAGVLAVANRWLWVYEDPRIKDVEELLPATNCGACGTAGCQTFAEALVAGDVKPSQCTVAPREATEEISELLGVDAGDVEKRLPYLACAGGAHVARTRSHYAGLESCRAASLVAGGPKGCSWGCIGLGDCADVCEFDAITMDRHGLPIVDAEKCTACGDCVDICPKNLFSLHPVSRRLWVACANRLDGDEAEADCEVACTGCERCAKDSPEGLIAIKDNLAVIDYDHNGVASPVSMERCPTGAIVWLDADQGRVQGKKGKDAKPIYRTEPLPVRHA